MKLGVLNRERTSARYAVQSSSCAPLVNVPKLSPGQEWRGDLQCRAIQGSGKVEFILYREGSSSPYRSLSLNLQPAP